MNRTPTTLFNGSHRAAAEMKRRMRTLLDKKQVFKTHYSADDTPESDRLPEWADEVDELRRDSNIGKALVLLNAVCGILGFVAYVLR